jgi:hypothetical protein
MIDANEEEIEPHLTINIGLRYNTLSTSRRSHRRRWRVRKP